MTKKIAIIGGSGFVGSRLSKRFRTSGLDSKVFDLQVKQESEESSFVDVENPETLEKIEGFNIIINLAAIHKDNVRPISRYDEVNVEGARQVCSAARKYNINKIIFTSSVAVYGFAPEDTDESGKINYFNDYGRTKYLAEKVYMKWYEEDPTNRSLVIIRPTVIFGEGNRGNVYNLLKQISKRRFLMVGRGKNIKSMAYVENVAAFLEYSLNFSKGKHLYNYIDKPDFDMNELVSKTRKFLFGKNNIGLRLPRFLGIVIGYIADLLSKLTGRPLPVSSIRVKKFMGTTQFSSSINQTGFVPEVSLEEGLCSTLRYEFIEDNSNNRTFDTE